MQRLTEKQEKFVQELVKGKSQREAYKEAYEKSRLWKDTAVDTQASILFKNSKVLERYNELMDRLVKESEDECIVTAKEVLIIFPVFVFSSFTFPSYFNLSHSCLS